MDLAAPRPQSRSLLSEGAVYALGVLAARAAGFLMIPVFTRVVTPAEYGCLDLIDTSSTALNCLVAVAITSSFMREYEAESTEQGRAQVVASALLGLWALGAGVALVLASLAPLLARALVHDAHFTGALRVAFATVAMFGTIEVPLMLLRARSQARRFVAFTLARTAAGVACNVLFVVVLRRGVLGFVWSNLLTTTGTALLLSGPLLRRSWRYFSLQRCLAMLRVGAPVVPGSLAMLLVHNGDRFVLAGAVPLADVGIYGLGYKLGMLLTYTVGMSFEQAWTGRCWRVYREPDGPRTFARVGTWYALVLAFAALGLALIAPELVALMASPRYARAAQIVPVIAAAYALREWASFHKVGLLATGRTRAIALFEPASAAANLALTAALVPRFGIAGAAWATLGTMALLLALSLPFSRRAYPVDYPLGRIAAAALVALGLYLVARALPVPEGLVGLAVRLLCAALYLPVLVLLRPREAPASEARTTSGVGGGEGEARKVAEAS